MGLPRGRCPVWALRVLAKFFERRHDFGILARVPRSGAQMREAKGLEQARDMAFVVIDAEALFNHPLQIHSAPADNAIRLPIRASLDDVRQFSFLRIRQS